MSNRIKKGDLVRGCLYDSIPYFKSLKSARRWDGVEMGFFDGRDALLVLEVGQKKDHLEVISYKTFKRGWVKLDHVRPYP